MRFEFDKKKSASNKKKHGIDFIEAQQLRNDSNKIVIPARSTDEPRYAVIAMLNGKIWSAFCTTGNRGCP
jgi:uncharacterized protein